MNVLTFFGEDVSMSESSSQRGDEGAKNHFLDERSSWGRVKQNGSPDKYLEVTI